MQIVKQFSVSLVNRPGVLANITRALADEKINIVALTISDTAELGVMRMLVDKPDIVRNVLSRFDSPVSETDVILIDLPNRPGALSSVAERLSREHINIQYAYATTGTAGGKATAVIKVQYPDKAMAVLREAKRRPGGRVPTRQNFGRR